MIISYIHFHNGLYLEGSVLVDDQFYHRVTESEKGIMLFTER